jgi:non-canonical (house-cleaning) NTP pyrophosphatase
MATGMPQYPLSETALLDVDRAHKALEKVQAELEAAIDAANERIAEQFNPIVFASQSVLYEAMGKAASAGFTYAQLRETMDCDSH